MATIKIPCAVSHLGETVFLLPGDTVPDGVVISNPEVLEDEKPKRSQSSKAGK